MHDKTQQRFAKRAVPASAGIGLKSVHYQDIVSQQPQVGWVEIHPENYFGAGGLPHYYLEKIRQDYPLSMHAVGLSLGSENEIFDQHLQHLQQLVHRYQPGLISEHLSWSHHQSNCLNDLLPLPYTNESLMVMVNHIDQTQHLLQHSILIENPSTYLRFKDSEITEVDFLLSLVQRTGCYLLIDINNLYVSASNHQFDPYLYLNQIPRSCVKELHIAGHSVQSVEGSSILIDDHGSHVCDAVWALYAYALERFDAQPVLIEWDTNIPALHVLLKEAEQAQQRMIRIISESNVADSTAE